LFDVKGEICWLGFCGTDPLFPFVVPLATPFVFTLAASREIDGWSGAAEVETTSPLDVGT
jgi:hypothetical protein